MPSATSTPPLSANRATEERRHPLLSVTCFIIIAIYALLSDLKGINTDEGLRLGIMNAGQTYQLNAPTEGLDWAGVLKAGHPYAYQPLYFLIQHTVMRVAHSQSEVLLKFVNIGFLWLSLQGLLCLSKNWRLPPRLFLILVFSLNAYLLMHVLQLREYILGVTFYIWSTWMVLRLQARRLVREWIDIAWFSAYGVLLVLGFYVQTWVAFVAIAQGLFLGLWRRDDRVRFYAHLGLSYLIVLIYTLPFLSGNNQRVDVGRWGRTDTELLPQLTDGFSLVLSGHLFGHSLFTYFVLCCWLAIITSVALLLIKPMRRTAAPETWASLQNEGPLMLLSMAIPLAFQIAYFYRLDNLSVWPRYFVLHYFFLFWLLALAVRYLHELSTSQSVSMQTRRISRWTFGAASAVLLASSAYQIRSYYEDPYLDTGMTHDSNWRTVAANIAGVIRPEDIMLVHEILNRTTLTFTRPISNRVLMLVELEHADLESVDRIIYLESILNLAERDALTARLATLGYGKMQPIRMKNTSGSNYISEWQLLVFQR